MISFDCPNCGKNLKTKDDKAGMKSRCPQCSEVIDIPQADGGAPAEDNPYAYDKSGTGDDGTKECPACGETIQAAAVKCKHCGEMLKKTRRSGSQDYAGFWTRFCAAFIDGFIVNILNFGVGFAIGLVLAMAAGQQGGVAEFAQVIAGLAGVVVQWLYFAIQESSESQATIGKKALGIIVTGVNGERLSFGRATGRHFAKIPSAMICVIGFIMAGFTEKKQALHDMIAGCLVVRK